MIRPVTPISRAHSNDFPSPRIGGSNTDDKAKEQQESGGNNFGGGRNYDILPNITSDAQGRRIDSEEYMKAHF